MRRLLGWAMAGVMALLAAGCSVQPIAPVSPPGPVGGAEAAWEVETLLVAPGAPGRLYALLKDSAAPLWASPAARVRLLVSDDFAATWVPFPGGLPVAAECIVNVALAPAAPDALYASACDGLYAWDGSAGTWERRSDALTDAVAVAAAAPGAPETVWAAAHGDGIIRSGDGGQTWQDASAGLVTFGGVTTLVADTGGTLYAVIRPQYAGSYLRRALPGAEWETLPTPLGNATIETGLALDRGDGALYVTTLVAPVGLWRAANAGAPDAAGVAWELVHDFGQDARVSLLAAGGGPGGTALYANVWPLTPLAEGGAAVGAPVLHRSLDGGQTWEPLPAP